MTRVSCFGFYIFLVGMTSVGLYFGCAWYAHSNLSDIAPQFTPNDSLNQKILFLKNLWPLRSPATAVFGASMALNNFDSDRFEEADGHRVINLGAYGLTLSEVWRLYSEVNANFPIQNVIVVSQFTELRDFDRDSFFVSPALFSRYVTGKMDWIEEFLYRNLAGSGRMLIGRQELLQNRSNYTSSAFTKTGGVPLDIYGQLISSDRWNALGLGSRKCIHCGSTLQKICEQVKSSGKSLTIVVSPLSPYIEARRPDIAEPYEHGRQQINDIATQCGARVFDVNEYGHFDNSCFVDFEHLNAHGARALTDLFIRWSNGHPPAKPEAIRCSSLPASQGGRYVTVKLEGSDSENERYEKIYTGPLVTHHE